MQIMKKNKVEFDSAEFSVCLLSSPSGSISGNVRWCPSVALGRMFEAISNPQSVTVLFSFGLSSLFCSADFLSAQHPGVGHLMSNGTVIPPPPASRGGFQCEVKGGNTGTPLRGTFQSSGIIEGVFPYTCATHLGLSLIISIMYIFLRISCPFHVRG